MSEIRIDSIKIKNYRSFGDEQIFKFPRAEHKKPIAIVGPNNCGKTNLINAILYGVGYKFAPENCFTKFDLHNLDYSNLIQIESQITAKADLDTINKVNGKHCLKVTKEHQELKTSIDRSFFGTLKYYNVFFINFHCIKEEISTQKTSWGNLKSFLGKHIQKIVAHDTKMHGKKEQFSEATKEAASDVLEGSDLEKFVERIKSN